MRVKSAVACALTATALAVAFALALLSHRGWNPGALVVAGDQYTDASRVAVPVEKNSAGYDGQFYYRLARNPFTSSWTDYGIRLDVPTYRQQRILLPLLLWVLSFGQERPLAILFLLINIGSVSLLAWCSAKVVESASVNAWWSAAVWLYPGWLISMTRDCAEILEVALLMATLLAVRRGRIFVATLLAIAAVLTKETAMIAIAMFAIANPPLFTALAAHFALKFTLFRVWNAAPSLGTGHFSVPFAGLVHSFAMQRAFPLFTTIEICALFAMVIAVFFSVRHVPLIVAAAFALYIPLMAILDQGFWIEDWSFLRASSELWVFGGLIAAIGRNRAGLAISAATWLLVAAHIIRS
jgi:hypothetical protein